MRSSARSTKASAAIDKLKKRSGNENYSMAMNNSAMFTLLLNTSNGESQRLCEPLSMEDFVAFVNVYGSQTPKRVSKLDIEFSKQLSKKD